MVRGENKKRKGKTSWNQMVKFHISPGRLLGVSILLAVHPPLHPPNLSGQVRPSANWLPLAANGEEGWARGHRRGGGVCVGQGRGRQTGGGKGLKKARVAEKKKKKNPGWEKSDGPRRETS